jgi:hypothetical protein
MGMAQIMVGALAAAVTAASLPAAAQLIPSAQLPSASDLKPVDPGAGDTGPLSRSTRLVQLDLRLNKQFEGVYSFERTDAFGHTQTWYVRSDGGLTAIFPRSQYVDGAGGLLAQVPAGTVWLIGGLPEGKSVSAVAAPRAFNALDFSAPKDDLPPPAREPAVPRPYERNEPSIWNSDQFRRQRLERLMGGLSAQSKAAN